MFKTTITGIVIILFLSISISLCSQPQPGDLFKNYIWTTPENSYNFLRIIGDGDYLEPVNLKRFIRKRVLKMAG